MVFDGFTALVVSAAAAGVYLLSWGIRSAIRILQDHTSAMKGVSAEAALLRSELTRNREQLERAASIFQIETSETRKAIATWPDSLQEVVKLGLECARMVEELRAMRREQERHPFGRPLSPGVPPQPSQEMADLEYRIQQYVKEHGVTREQAMMMLNPANQSSVWDGFGEWST